MSIEQNTTTLQRGLSSRHIQLIALGGAIGTGLFLGTAGVLKTAGPSMILGYAIAGFIAFLIMRQLGEMVVQEPVAGSFGHFATRYWGRFAGFLSGWNYWIMYALVCMAELTAVGKYVQFWWPEVPIWVSAALFFVLVNVINLSSVKAFGETEFWFAIVKVAAIIGMILLASYLLVSGNGGPQASVSNLWEHGGFFPNGFTGMLMAMGFILFAFGGMEMIGITAAESDNPRRVIPKAINQVVWRIIIFYVGALTLLLALYPWDQLLVSLSSSQDAYGASPFVKIFSLIGSDVAAHVLNFVILTAALSVYNGGAYCMSRMLFGLAEQGNAPKVFLRVNRRGIPVAAVLASAAVTGVCLLINYLVPGNAFELMMTLAVAALLINWVMITLTHMRFRRAMRIKGEALHFRALWFPFGNILCLAFMAMILVVLLMIPGIRISVFMIPVWVVLLWVAFKFAKPPMSELQSPAFTSQKP
ncbi:aromatic amino acid transport protein AroP [Pseudomonas sp. StFLB209]|uniref:amino acid permease n=1 Tax=Pseudomonas sp. StFLB209 TaxID=1028989 RepID=UPI0004F867E1|nr:amino acid permease [Pseudomonas sp. StFLB209]BAP40977.1 aromatic amino acid transport protein AroP [Pseudomonas sp. StFLB209]